MKYCYIFICFLFFTIQIHSQTLWLDEIQVSLMEAGWGESKAKFSVEGNTLKVNNKTFTRGIGTHAVSKIMFNLQNCGIRFTALAGVDDESGNQASVEFIILGDQKMLWQSGLMKKGDEAKKIDISLKGVEKLALLVTDAGDGINYDHADWLNAAIEYKEKKPMVIIKRQQKPVILTPPASEFPKINYPRVIGGRPGRPILFAVPATGKKPMSFSAANLPEGLVLDVNKGIIRGIVPAAGHYKVTLTVTNEYGKDQQVIRISSGEKLALTPPMGWNSWNCWGLSVDDPKVREAADAMASRLQGHGWAYINIDDGWEAAQRDEKGMLQANEKFPDMKLLSDYIHDRGLKMGIYSSPGEKTCGGYLGSFGHEKNDAETWAAWGIDYLKYDWCSYSEKAVDRSLMELKKPYLVMRDELFKVNRDIVYSLCQYGMGNVWEWGETVGGNLWRTTGDITDSWKSMSGIGFSQGKASAYAQPGRWNDPDMLVVGKVGWGPSLHNSNLTPDEQYTHLTLWSLLSAPLLIGCDMAKLDDFTLNLLTNDEVIAINQDPKGNQANRVSVPGEDEIWKKEMEDGSVVVGLFYTRSLNEGYAAEFQWDNEIKPKKIPVTWAQLGISGDYRARDVWRQKDLGQFHEKINAEVNWHGCSLIRLTPVK
jgi:alpha-galactosidase